MTYVNPLLESTVAVFEQLKNTQGEYISMFLNSVPLEPQTDLLGLQTFEFKGHTIRDSTSQKVEMVTTLLLMS